MCETLNKHAQVRVLITEFLENQFFKLNIDISNIMNV